MGESDVRPPQQHPSHGERAGMSREELEETLLGGERRYTRREAADRAGVTIEFANRLWRSLGFATLPDDAVAFTDGDVAALRKSGELIRSGLLDEEKTVRLARATGQTMARLAEWQTDTLLGSLTAPDSSPASEEVLAAVELTERLMPEFEPLLVHVWRRQLAASGTRALAAADEEMSPGRTQLAVGFADLVAFTRLVRELDEKSLAEVVEGFESMAADAIAAVGGRLVKTLGDEVLFVADTPQVGAEVAVEIADAVGIDPGFTDVRVGVAYGPVLPRMGDVFGTTVNLASRLTSLARPGTVLVDRQMAGELLDSPYEIIRIRARPARGLGMVQPFVLRRRR
ncbi:MAG: adenylate/guanylate cyclase domain-containing protein [Streptosporangiales bacterium]|nr:adenylate/guanylate cyclase domain-containing protein [Streptosporangiales bacterium]